MNQTWEEHRENHEAFLRELEREAGEAWTPAAEARAWRRRFLYAVLIDLVVSCLLVWILSH